ncbi:MAG: hypothetical protein ACI841_001265 [Planctomycetota bacterium]|jgi:hypothetical protein
MFKNRLPHAITALALVFAASTQEDSDELTKRVEALEKSQVAVETYLAAQSKAGKSYESALATVEKGGFTAGINPDSRVALIAAIKADLKVRQAAVPGAKPVVKDDSGAKRGWRR